MLLPDGNEGFKIVPLIGSPYWKQRRTQHLLKAAISALGVELSRDVIFSMMYSWA
jgi:hypothetical protein